MKSNYSKSKVRECIVFWFLFLLSLVIKLNILKINFFDVIYVVKRW